MNKKNKATAEKLENEYRMKAGDFDKMMRCALGTPPLEPKLTKKKRKSLPVNRGRP